MKKITFLLALGLVMCVNAKAQKAFPEVFEVEGDTADWEVFENGENVAEDFVVVDNPAKEGINTSNKCVKFTVVDNAQPWAGAVSTSFGEMTFTEENHVMTMMVYKSTLSRCLLKAEIKDGDFTEVFVTNESVDEWEKLTFDFSEAIGKTYTGLAFFPDFPESRTEGSVNYVDNIGWLSDGTTAIFENNTFEFAVYPNPATEYIQIESPKSISKIQLLDLSGKLITQINSIDSNSATLNLQSINQGFYLIQIISVDGQTATKKLQVH